jgi:hypothetical protein
MAKSNEPDAGVKALELLEHMIELSENGYTDVSPNTQVYCSVIAALGKSGEYGAADSAERILNDMERMYALGNNDVAPNTIVFNAVIDAWARSRFIFKTDKAMNLLLRMEEEVDQGNIMYKPDIITYNSVINAAANAFGDPEVKLKAFKMALIVFKKIKLSPDVKPTSRTYFMLIKAIRRLVSTVEEKDTMSSKLLEFCLKDGLLNSHILDQFELACSSKDKFTDFFGSRGYDATYPIDIRKMKAEWTENSNRLR